MKTLVFSFDGTGNEPSQANEFKQDESITNVLKLHVMMGGCMEAGKSAMGTAGGSDQKTYYYNGIGTREGRFSIPLVGRIRSWINMAMAPAFGDARRILNEAEEDFEASGYEQGDRIVVFGFSRGAALARKFVSEILADDEQREVSFLGVYDTVAAMNGIHRRGEAITSDVLFENGNLNQRVRRAVHLVALDEERVAFTPTLINRDPAGGERILEVWMPGIHSDVGGGYWMDGLADLSLSLMIGECRKALDGDIEIRDGIDDIKRLLAAQTSRLADVTADDVVIRGLAHGVLHENSGLDAKLGGREPRAVCVVENDRPVPVRKDAPEDLPLVHSAVRERFLAVAGYRPAALRGLRYRLFDEDEPESPVLEGIADLRDAAEAWRAAGDRRAKQRRPQARRRATRSGGGTK